MHQDEHQAMTDAPIACSLTTPPLRAREHVLKREIFVGIQEMRELPDDYALRFPGDGA